MTEKGAPRVRFCGEGPPHLTLHKLITLMTASPLLSSQSALLGTCLTPELVDLPVNASGLTLSSGGGSSPTCMLSEGRSRPLPHLNLGRQFPSEGRRNQQGLWGSCLS